MISSFVTVNEVLGVQPQAFRRKNTSAIIASAIIGGTAATFGAIATSNSAETRQSQNQSWQTGEWTRQFDLTNEEYDRRFAQSQDEWTRQADYNSPVNQAERMREAGFNPSAMVGASGGSSASQPISVPNPQVSSPSTPQISQVNGADTGLAQVIQAVGSVVKDIATASEKGLNTAYLQKTFDTRLRKAVADLDLAQLVVKGHQLEYFINDQLKDVRIQQAYGEYMNLCAKTYNEYLTGGEIESQTALNKAQAKLSATMENLKGWEAMQASILTANFQELLNARLEEMRSGSAANRASASASNAQAGLFQSQKEYTDALTKTENALRQGRIDALELQNTSYRIANTVGASNMRTFVATESDRLTALISQYQREGYVTQEAAARALKAAKDNDWYEVKLFFDCLGQAAGSVGSVGGVINTAAKNKIHSRFNELYQSEVRMNESGEATFIERGTAPYGY